MYSHAVTIVAYEIFFLNEHLLEFYMKYFLVDIIFCDLSSPQTLSVELGLYLTCETVVVSGIQRHWVCN